jgi:uncharacterized membrane protein YfcA
MRIRPVRLNSAVATLFMVGAACFVVGSLPPYIALVGASADAVTYAVGAVFFTSASALQLLQAQSPAMTDVDAVTQHERRPVRLLAWLPHDAGWWAAATQLPGTVLFNVSTTAALAHNLTAKEADKQIWLPDVYGSVLFLVSSTFALVAVGALRHWRPGAWDWRIAWVNMLGSVFFMLSALGSFVLPKSGDLISQPLSLGGTAVGAACFLVAAAWMLPQWRQTVRDRGAAA